MARLPRIVPACAAAALAAAGCGSSSDDPIEVTKEFIERYDRGDAGVCADLVTERYLRSLGEAAGQSGRSACEAQVRELARSAVAVDAFPAVRERGDRVEVSVRLFVDGRQQTQTITLVRRGDDLLVDRVESDPARG